MDTVEELSSSYKVSQWNRFTVADGQWQNDNTILPLSARDVFLAKKIDELSGAISAVETEGVYDGDGDSIVVDDNIISIADNYTNVIYNYIVNAIDSISSYYKFALANGCEIDDSTSVALGTSAIASDGSFAFNGTASNDSISLGPNSITNSSVAIGFSNTNSNLSGDIIIGSNLTASENDQILIGNSAATLSITKVISADTTISASDFSANDGDTTVSLLGLNDKVNEFTIPTFKFALSGAGTTDEILSAVQKSKVLSLKIDK